MAVSLTPYLKAVSEAEDPKKEILKWVGSTKKEKLNGDRVMVATYARPNKTAGGVLLSDGMTVEDRFQGTVGLLVLIGDTAFKYDGSYSFEGQPPKIGDWVTYRPADGFEIAFRRASCRIFRSESIIGVASCPLLYY
jgi:co-chaperonin GroES (HSP10)